MAQRTAAPVRPTRAEVHVRTVVANYAEIQRWVGDTTRVLAVVKADAYGHGATTVALALERAGAFGFGVALAEEGLELRDAGVGGAILVLNGVFGNAHREVLRRRLWPVVYDIQTVLAFAEAATEPFKVHLKIDTGMSRLGVRWDRLHSFLEALRAVPSARIDGVMTHFAAAEDDAEFTREQLTRFEASLKMLRAAGHAPRWLHAANSAGCARADARYDLVRPGLALYGVAPRGTELVVKPTLRLRSEVIAVRSIEPGGTVGYGRTWRAPTSGARIATVPAGYGDGLLWSSQRDGEGGQVLLRGRRCPIVGRISMDLTTIDVTGLEAAGGAVALGEEIVLLGEQKGDHITLQEVADAAGTIPYEVLTSISRRVPRVVS